MEYLNITKMAEKWRISPRRLQTLCANGKISGATRFGKAWMIPKNAVKPIDGRTKAGKKDQLAKTEANIPMPRKTPFLHMTDLYNTAGEAEKSIEALSYNPEAQTLLAAGIAYSRGQIDSVYETANYLLQKHSGYYSVISSGMLLALCAIWRGDLFMWRQAKLHIATAPAKSDIDRDIIAFSLMAVDSMLYDVDGFPEWFKIGRFEPLHKDALPAAKVFHAKYLYAASYDIATRQRELQGVQGMSLMTIVTVAIEPMIAQAVADNSIIAEIYLRMTCAAIYHNAGNDEQAIYHIDRALATALPDKLYGLIAEYCRVLGPLIEQQLSRLDESVLREVKKLYTIYNTGWSKLSGIVRGRTISTTLTPRQREVAKLAAFGLKNKEIADSLHMSISAVKQAITDISNKTGMSRDEFATVL